jgi:hypothetical protein
MSNEPLRKLLQERLEYHEVWLSKFKAALASNPRNAFVWADTVVKAACVGDLCKEVQASLDKGTSVEDILRYLNTRVHEMASTPPIGMTDMARCVALQELAAVADLYHDIKSALL